eukprot:3447858-Amphidinium_carterae.1
MVWRMRDESQETVGKRKTLTSHAASVNFRKSSHCHPVWGSKLASINPEHHRSKLFLQEHLL